MTIMLCPFLLFVLAVGVVARGEPTQPPIACRTNALDKTQRKRQQELLDLVRRSAQATQELPDGYAFRLAADPALFQQAAEWVSLERRCCPFVQFTLDWKRDDAVWIAFTGGPGVKDFLAAEILGAKPTAASGR
jgi:hypothetical protein